MNKLKKVTTGIFGTIAIPTVCFLAFYLLCASRGISLFGDSGHMLSFIRSLTTIGFTAYALSLNLNSGRFDFSLGSIALLSSMIAIRIVLAYELPAIVLFVLCLAIGGVLGLLSGLLYVALRLPPIIVSLGVTLIYEALGFIVTDGEGVLITTKTNYLAFPSMTNLIIINAVGLAVVVFIFRYTRFGYNCKALQNGQKISVSTGINEKTNAVACYALAGVMMGVVGCVNLCVRGNASVSLNFASLSAMFVAFLPMFIGGFISRFSDEKLGVFLGAVTSAIISLGFVRLNVSASMQSLYNAVILLVFLIYLNNQGLIKKMFTPISKSKKAETK